VRTDRGHRNVRISREGRPGDGEGKGEKKNKKGMKKRRGEDSL
jgi:hypothetical protein